MEILKYILIALYAIVCLALIVVALMQTKDTQGASGTITGSTTSNFYEKNKGRTKEGRIKKINNLSRNCFCCTCNSIRNCV